MTLVTKGTIEPYRMYEQGQSTGCSSIMGRRVALEGNMQKITIFCKPVGCSG